MYLLGLGLVLALLKYLEIGPVAAWSWWWVPMFFYIAHIYLLHLIYLLFAAFYGPNQGERFGFSQVWMIWAMALPVLACLYRPCLWFGRLKQEGRQRWMTYF